MISFFLVVILYTVIALAVQTVLVADDTLSVRAPIASLLQVCVGSTARQVVSLLGFIIVTANFTGVVWAFSRMLFDAAREGIFPVALTHLFSTRHVPAIAILAIIAIFAGFVVLSALEWIELSGLFALASVFFCLLSGGGDGLYGAAFFLAGPPVWWGDSGCTGNIRGCCVWDEGDLSTYLALHWFFDQQASFCQTDYSMLRR